MMWEAFDVPFNTAVINPSVVAAGTTQADATQLDALTSVVTTVPTGSGVRIIRPAKYRQIVANQSTNPLKVWPRQGQRIYPNASADTPVTVQPGQSVGLIVQDDSAAHVIFNTSSFGGSAHDCRTPHKSPALRGLGRSALRSEIVRCPNYRTETRRGSGGIRRSGNIRDCPGTGNAAAAAKSRKVQNWSNQAWACFARNKCWSVVSATSAIKNRDVARAGATPLAGRGANFSTIKEHFR